MSLFRTAIVLTGAILLLPSDKAKQQEFYTRASAAAQDAATYCDRNAETCAKAAEYWEGFKTKAAFAGELALEAWQRYQVESETQSAAREDGASVKPAKAAKQGTLSARDMESQWRGTIRRQGI